MLERTPPLTMSGGCRCSEGQPSTQCDDSPALLEVECCLMVDRCIGFSRNGTSQTVYFDELYAQTSTSLVGRQQLFRFKLRDAIGSAQTVYPRSDTNALTLDIPALTFIFQSEVDGETLVFGQADINSSCNGVGGRNWTGPSNDDTEWSACWAFTNVQELMRAFVRDHSVRQSDQSSATNRFRLAVVDASNARIRTRDGTISDF